MTTYAAMIRGVGPDNPNMRGEKLKWAFEQMGMQNVRSFLASGNVLFESKFSDTTKLEKLCEESLPKLLNFSRDVFVISRENLRALVETNPFAGRVHENAGKAYLTVTFFKSPPEHLPSLPFRPEGKSFEVVANVNDVLCCVVDLTTGKTPDLMQWLERNYGKHITTRTWLTVTRMLAKLN